MRSPRFGSAVLQEALRHARAAVAAPERGALARGRDQNPLRTELELDFGARLQSSFGANGLRDHNLAFGSDTMCHTSEV